MPDDDPLAPLDVPSVLIYFSDDGVEIDPGGVNQYELIGMLAVALFGELSAAAFAEEQDDEEDDD